MLHEVCLVFELVVQHASPHCSSLGRGGGGGLVVVEKQLEEVSVVCVCVAWCFLCVRVCVCGLLCVWYCVVCCHVNVCMPHPLISSVKCGVGLFLSQYLVPPHLKSIREGGQSRTTHPPTNPIPHCDSDYYALNSLTIPQFTQPMEVYVDDETKLTLHGLQQHYVKLQDREKNRKLFDLLDVLEFNQASLKTFTTTT